MGNLFFVFDEHGRNEGRQTRGIRDGEASYAAYGRRRLIDATTETAESPQKQSLTMNLFGIGRLTYNSYQRQPFSYNNCLRVGVSFGHSQYCDVLVSLHGGGLLKLRRGRFLHVSLPD